ncbi:MFS transporter [Aeromicrobium massiliense]|uniref:MFS transporter n=1 Tax=Aeromicrobium massiliense TaxID=1464554 RepID=UPI0002FBD62E|nr:MFS transporter [Aeromicrobium massiliense]
MTFLRGERALWALVLAFTVTMIGTTMPTPLYTHYQAELGFSLSTSTVIFAVYAMGVLAALLVTGRWSDAVGRRPLLLGGLAFALASDLVFLVADATWILLLGRVLSGISAGVFVGTATAAVVEAAPENRRAWAPVAATAANIGGLGLGPLLAGLLVDLAPWPLHLTFVVHAVLTLVVAVLVWGVPETVERVPGAKLQLQHPEVPTAIRSAFVAAGIAGFAGFAVTGLLTAVSPRLVAQVLDDPSAVVQDSIIVVALMVSVVVQVVLRRIPTNTGVDLGCALLALGSLVLVAGLWTDSYAVLLASAFLIGPGQGLSFGKGLASLLERVEPHQRAGVSSAFFIVGYVAISLPVIGAGLAAQEWGLEAAAESFGLGVAALSLLALAALVVEQRRTQPATV